MYDLIIVGGGPAGLTAAIYALRKRINALLISADLGGKTNYHLSLPWIEDYQVIRGLEVVNKFRSELEYLKFAHQIDKVEYITREPEGFLVRTAKGQEIQARAAIIATGTRQKRLKVPGEKEFTMRGLCYSALSYAPLFIDRETMVVGEGELALRSAAELATVAAHVYLTIGEGSALELPLGQKLLHTQNVSILENYQVVEIQGNSHARSVILKTAQDETTEIIVDGLFIEMGLTPNSKMVAELVELDEQGRIRVDCSARTSVPGIFAAGDVTTIFAEQVLIAVGEGAKAALSAYDYLLPNL